MASPTYPTRGGQARADEQMGTACSFLTLQHTANVVAFSHQEQGAPGSPHHRPFVDAGESRDRGTAWLSVVTAPGSAPPGRSTPGGETAPTTEIPTAAILQRARKLAGLWVMEDNAQATYLEWMDFCQDWARHRLKQIYFEQYDFQSVPSRERTNPAYVAQWAWENAPNAPPYRTTAELDRMANDICEEAWDHGHDIRAVLVSLVRRLQTGGLLPQWFYQAVVG